MSIVTVERTRLRPAAMVLVFGFILVGGALRSVEAGCQNQLKLALKNVWLCGVISYAVAFTGVTVILLVTLALGRAGSNDGALLSLTARPWPRKADLRALPRWAPFGGLIGGAAIFAMITVASSVGVSTFNAVIIAGQMFLALALDHFGLMGFQRRRMNLQRVFACVLIIIGSYLMARY